MIGRLAVFLGFPSAGLLGWALLTGIAAMAAASIATAIVVHRYDVAIHGQAVADLRTEAAAKLVAANALVLAAERRGAERISQLETDYAALSKDHARLREDSARLSGDLHAAAERLRRAGEDRRSSGDGMPQAAGIAGGCEGLRTALDRALDAVELLKAAGDGIAADGALAVDVATIAAQAAGATITARPPEIAP